MWDRWDKATESEEIEEIIEQYFSMFDTGRHFVKMLEEIIRKDVYSRGGSGCEFSLWWEQYDFRRDDYFEEWMYPGPKKIRFSGSISKFAEGCYADLEYDEYYRVLEQYSRKYSTEFPQNAEEIALYMQKMRVKLGME